MENAGPHGGVTARAVQREAISRAPESPDQHPLTPPRRDTTPALSTLHTQHPAAPYVIPPDGEIARISAVNTSEGDGHRTRCCRPVTNRGGAV